MTSKYFYKNLSIAIVAMLSIGFTSCDKKDKVNDIEEPFNAQLIIDNVEGLYKGTFTLASHNLYGSNGWSDEWPGEIRFYRKEGKLMMNAVCHELDCNMTLGISNIYSQEDFGYNYVFFGNEIKDKHEGEEIYWYAGGWIPTPYEIWRIIIDEYNYGKYGDRHYYIENSKRVSSY